MDSILFLELSRTSLPAPVPDPGLRHRPARARSSRPGNIREGSSWTAGLAAQAADVVLYVVVDLCPRPLTVVILIGLSLRPFSSIFDTCRSGQELLGKLVATCVEEESAGSTGCFCCEELGICIGVLELRWAYVVHFG